MSEPRRPEGGRPAQHAGGAAVRALPSTDPSRRIHRRRGRRPRARAGGSDLSNYVAVIRVVGVGGAGCNAVDRMIEAGLRGVEFIAVNTDRQALEVSEADVRIPVGMEITRGLGTGGDAHLGEQAVRESEEQVRRRCAAATSSSSPPARAAARGPAARRSSPRSRARWARSPSRSSRGRSASRAAATEAAAAGLDALQGAADTVIIIPNDRLMAVLERGTSMVEAFKVCDDLLRQGVQGICDLITLPGLINLDFADVRTIISGAGTALLGIGYAGGGNRATEAAQAAIASPLLETPIDGARGILLGVTGGPDLSLVEVSEAAQVVADAADPEANIIFGATIDPELSGQVWVTVVAANFSGVRAGPPADAARARRGGPRRAVAALAPRRARHAVRPALPGGLVERGRWRRRRASRLRPRERAPAGAGPRSRRRRPPARGPRRRAGGRGVATRGPTRPWA